MTSPRRLVSTVLWIVAIGALPLLGLQADEPEEPISPITAAIEKLQDEEPHVRAMAAYDDVAHAAARAIHEIGGLEARHIPLLGTLLERGDPYLQRFAMRALSKIGEGADRYEAQVAAILAEGNDGTEGEALLYLARYGTKTEKVVETALSWLESDRKPLWMRARGARVLGLVRQGQVERRREALRTALRDPEAWIRAAAAWGFAHSTGLTKDAQADLLTATEDPDKWVRLYAAWALVREGLHVERARHALTPLLEDDDQMLLDDVAKALAE